VLEVIRTANTSPEIVATAVALGMKQGKTVIVVNHGVGFCTSLILGPLMNEASFILAEGIPIRETGSGLAMSGGQRRCRHRSAREARRPRLFAAVAVPDDCTLVNEVTGQSLLHNAVSSGQCSTCPSARLTSTWRAVASLPTRVSRL